MKKYRKLAKKKNNKNLNFFKITKKIAKKYISFKNFNLWFNYNY